MKHLFFLFAVLSITLSTNAREPDSIALRHRTWEVREVKKGIVWKKAHFDDLFGGKQIINLIEIDLKRHHKKLKLAGVSEGTKLTSSFARENEAIIAINGGFFNTRTGGGHDFIKIEGNVVNVSTNNSARADAYLAFDKKSIQIIPQTADSIRETRIANVLLAGPLLLHGGEITEIGKNRFNDNKHPRTAIALRGHTLIFITVDGRSPMAHGVSLFELSQLLKWYACDAAMNMDGGGSSAMYVQGQPYNGIVNYPSDNKQFDHLGERPVANIIYIKN